MTEPLTQRPERLRRFGRLAIVIGAVGSVGFLLLAAEHPPVFLLVLFALWIVSPFLLLAMADRMSSNWSPLTRATLHTVMFVVAVASLVSYGSVVLNQSKAKIPFFVLVPPVSWVVMGVAISGAALIHRRA